MAYVSIAEYKAYMAALTQGQPVGMSSTEDTFLSNLLSAAQQFIESETGRAFEAATETRYYDDRAVAYNDPALLIVDKDLLTVTALTNGDGAAVSSGNYWLEPYNGSPKFGIRLKTTEAWVWAVDTRVSVAGTWGYTAAANADVKRVTCRLAYLEQQRRTATGEVAVLGEGAFTFQAEVPKDIGNWLRRYTRRSGWL